MFYYLVGIKGSAMSALAKLLIDDGHVVRGADDLRHYFTEDTLDCEVDSFDNIEYDSKYTYIIGNAYINHSSALKIIESNYTYYKYPEFINYYFSKHKLIAVSGSHGKTTTVKMIATLAPDSSFIIGDGSGKGNNKNVLILEACEYKNTFLNYSPNIAVVLNIDYDHPDFFKNEDEYRKSFIQFIKKSNLVIANGDDSNIKNINSNNMILYGMDDSNDVQFDYYMDGDKAIVNVLGEEYVLPIIGKHYAYDFVASLLVSKYLGIDSSIAKERIEKFEMPKRRLEIKEYDKSIIIHDYAHHPKEIECVYDTLRAKYPKKMIKCIFEPHTVSRSLSFKDGFKKALNLFDKVYLLPIFSSVREKKSIIIEEQLYRYWGFERINESYIKNIIYDNEVVVLLGAGDINEVYSSIVNVKNM